MSDCEVCEGQKFYPIHNRHGRELYAIRCPECCGSGEKPDEPDHAEPEFEYPPSTAASVKTEDDLRAWKERENGARP